MLSVYNANSIHETATLQGELTIMTQMELFA